MESLRTLLLAALALAAGACANTPTDAVRTVDRPAFNGGGSYGSGHRIGGGDGTDGTASTTGTEETAPADTASTALRGGGSYGSGH